MYAAVEQYLKTAAEAEENHRKLSDGKYRATLDEERANPTQRQEIWARYYKASDEARDAYNRTLDEAHTALREGLEAEGDKLALWILEHTFEEYPNYSLTVLQALPATVTELTALARKNDWCNVFDNFLRQARRAGVIAPMTAREQLEDWFTRELWGRGSTYFRQFQEGLDAVITEAKAQALDEYHNQHKAASE